MGQWLHLCGRVELVQEDAGKWARPLFCAHQIFFFSRAGARTGAHRGRLPRCRGTPGRTGARRGTVMFARRRRRQHPPKHKARTKPTMAASALPLRGGWRRSGPTIDQTYITADPSCEFEARRWCICYAASPQTEIKPTTCFRLYFKRN
jgi:hypothetical protein